MKHNLLNYFIVICTSLSFFNLSYCQSFSTADIPLSLGGATNFLDACGATPGKRVRFNVAGVGTLSSSMQLLEIDIQLKTDRNLAYLSCYIKAPDGTCMKIASRMGSTDATFTAQNVVLDYTFRSPETCLNKQPDYQPTSAAGQIYTGASTSKAGIFSTTDDMETVFNGKNANGEWVIYFGRTSTASTAFPTVLSAKLTFGAPLAIPSSTQGDCTASSPPIQWNGTPICLTTQGKTSGKAILPSYSGSCVWNNQNNNSIFIAFQPTTTNACISINGIANAQEQQSIVVSDNNTDGDNNPCTPSNSNTHWTTVSCPRDNIYASFVGATTSQNHCFTAVVGRTYYLVVDGSGGATSTFYLSGNSGLPVVLPVSFLSFSAKCVDGGIEFNWLTASEKNNDYFTIDFSQDGENWYEITRVKGAGNTSILSEYQFTDRQYFSGKVGYFRLQQTDFNGESQLLDVISVKNCNDQNDSDLTIVPNPSTGVIHILGTDKKNATQISVVSPVGKEVFRTQSEGNIITVDLSGQSKGIYLISASFSDGSQKVSRVIIE